MTTHHRICMYTKIQWYKHSGSFVILFLHTKTAIFMSRFFNRARSNWTIGLSCACATTSDDDVAPCKAVNTKWRECMNGWVPAWVESLLGGKTDWISATYSNYNTTSGSPCKWYKKIGLSLGLKMHIRDVYALCPFSFWQQPELALSVAGNQDGSDGVKCRNFFQAIAGRKQTDYRSLRSFEKLYSRDNICSHDAAPNKRPLHRFYCFDFYVSPWILSVRWTHSVQSQFIGETT